MDPENDRPYYLKRNSRDEIMYAMNALRASLRHEVCDQNSFALLQMYLIIYHSLSANDLHRIISDDSNDERRYLFDAITEYFATMQTFAHLATLPRNQINQVLSTNFQDGIPRS